MCPVCDLIHTQKPRPASPRSLTGGDSVTALRCSPQEPQCSAWLAKLKSASEQNSLGLSTCLKWQRERKRVQFWGCQPKVTLPCKEQHSPRFLLVLVHRQPRVSVISSLVQLRNIGGEGLLIPNIN